MVAFFFFFFGSTYLNYFVALLVVLGEGSETRNYSKICSKSSQNNERDNETKIEEVLHLLFL